MLNLLIHIFSLCFLYCGFVLNTFSKMVMGISLSLWPTSLKCLPVAFVKILFFTYPLCSAKRSFKVLLVSPIYYWGHLLHPSKYIIFERTQLTLVLMSTRQLFDVEETAFPSFTNGQMTYFWHLFIPVSLLLGLPLFVFGTLALTSLSLIIPPSP